MKNRRKLIKTGLLCAGLLLGTGYATVLSKTIEVAGTVKSKDVEVDVWVDVYSEDFDITSNGNTYTLTQKEGKVLENVGDTLSFEVQASPNFVDDGIDLELTSTITNEEFFEVTHPKTNGTSCGGLAQSAGTVKLIKLPITEEESVCEFTLTIVVSMVRYSCSW